MLCLSSFSTRKASPSVLLLQIAAPRGSTYPIRRRDLPLVPMSRMLPLAGYAYAVFWSILLLCGPSSVRGGTDSRNSGAADSPWRHRRRMPTGARPGCSCTWIAAVWST